MTYYVITHPKRGFYVEHRVNPITRKKMPRFTWKGARTISRKFKSQRQAQQFLDAQRLKPNHGMERCSATKIEELPLDVSELYDPVGRKRPHP